jgi:hypothetical protein
MFAGLRLFAVALVLTFWSSPARAGAACPLIGAPAVAAIFGGPVGFGVAGDVQAAVLCGFTARNETINVGVMPTSMMSPDPAAAFENAVAAGEMGVEEAVPGLGDRAVYVAANPGTAVADYGIYVLAGDRILDIDVTGTNDPGIKAALISAARRILGAF